MSSRTLTVLWEWLDVYAQHISFTGMKSQNVGIKTTYEYYTNDVQLYIHSVG